MSRNTRNTSCLFLVLAAGLLGGCTKTEDNALLGAGIGALAGQAIGGDTGSTLIGAGIGAAAGVLFTEDQSRVATRTHYID